MVNKFEDFDSFIDFSPQTTGKKRAPFTDAETADEFREKNTPNRQDSQFKYFSYQNV